MRHWELLTGDGALDRRNVDLLLSAVEQVCGSTDIEETVRSAVDGAIQVTGAQEGLLLLADKDGGFSVRVARHRDGKDLKKDTWYSQTAASLAWTTGESQILSDVEVKSGRRPSDSTTSRGWLSVLAVPLRARDRTIGLLYVHSSTHAKEHGVGDLALVTALAGLVATALEQARLAKDEAERERIRNELEVARRIQQLQAPKDVTAPPGFDLAFEGRSAMETSGDYHDVIPLEGGALALVVGDVSGKGLGPALYTVAVRAMLRTLLFARADLLNAVEALNAFLCRDMPSGRFMTLFLAVLDPEARTLTWIGAGHDSPLLCRRGEALTELKRTGPAFNLDPRGAYHVAGPLPLLTGDAVVLYTDGFPDARAENGEFWGEDRFQASFRSHAERGGTARQLLDGMLSDVERWIGVRPLYDDVTCVVLRALDAPTGRKG